MSGETLAIPVANGILPRPGCTVQGIFLHPAAARLVSGIEAGGELFLCPFIARSGQLYPAGMVARLDEMWFQPVMVGSPPTKAVALFARAWGMYRAKAKGFRLEGGRLMAQKVERLDLRAVRARGYAAICGAGWKPAEGYTEARSPVDLRVVISGVDYESGREVILCGNVGGVLSPEQAHTVEHAILRSLQEFVICTPRTLAQVLEAERTELKMSVALGFRLRMPEVFGVTSMGVCGNPLTNLAQFYLTQEVLGNLQRGESPEESIRLGRLKTLSRITEELDVTMEPRYRVLQGLKRGMLHDDSPAGLATLGKVIERFPLDPWD